MENHFSYLGELMLSYLSESSSTSDYQGEPCLVSFLPRSLNHSPPAHPVGDTPWNVPSICTACGLWGERTMTALSLQDPLRPLLPPAYCLLAQRSQWLLNETSLSLASGLGFRAQQTLQGTILANHKDNRHPCFSLPPWLYIRSSSLDHPWSLIIDHPSHLSQSGFLGSPMSI